LLAEVGRAGALGPGDYEVIVFAHDPRNGNTGIDRTTFIATKG
jgi:hypothetical protein